MVTGRLVKVNNNYYAILNLKHPDGRRLQKRFDLGLPIQNNKRRAEEKLNELCAWIIPFMKLRSGLLRTVFHEAHRRGIISEDPMEFVKKPKRERPKVSYYSLEEAQRLISEIKGTKLELPVTLSLAYGFRRSEVLGLHWEDIDFADNRISVRHSVVEGTDDGKRILVEKDSMKVAASRRTLPLFEPITTMLKEEWERKKALNPTFVCTDKNGQGMKPDVLTHDFKKFLADHGLRHIRYQDLRHSCASLLIAAHVPLIQVQHWLGHSTMLTTANMYAHLDTSLVDECGEDIKKI